MNEFGDVGWCSSGSRRRGSFVTLFCDTGCRKWLKNWSEKWLRGNINRLFLMPIGMARLSVNSLEVYRSFRVDLLICPWGFHSESVGSWHLAGDPSRWTFLGARLIARALTLFTGPTGSEVTGRLVPRLLSGMTLVGQVDDSRTGR